MVIGTWVCGEARWRIGMGCIWRRDLWVDNRRTALLVKRSHFVLKLRRKTIAVACLQAWIWSENMTLV